MKILLEGIDGIGKSSLSKELAKGFNIPCIKHLGKPKSIKRYKGCKIKYQLEVFRRFNRIMLSDIDIVYDRAHLGEFVYGPLYRGKPCCTLRKIENGTRTKDIALILLVTDNFEMLRDDGENFNSNNQKIEQEMFKNAFHESRIKDKIMIQVNEGNNFRNRDDIIKEVQLKLRKEKKIEKVYIQRSALSYLDVDESTKNCTLEEKQWYNHFIKSEYDADFDNPVGELYSEEEKEEGRRDAYARRYDVLSSGKGNYYEEQEQYENLPREESSVDDKLIYLAKILGTEEAIERLKVEAEDLIISLGEDRDKVEFELDKQIKIIRADEKRTDSKRYAKLTKAELRAKERDNK